MRVSEQGENRREVEGAFETVGRYALTERRLSSAGEGVYKEIRILGESQRVLCKVVISDVSPFPRTKQLHFLHARNEKGAGFCQPLVPYGSACWARTSDPLINRGKMAHFIRIHFPS